MSMTPIPQHATFDIDDLDWDSDESESSASAPSSSPSSSRSYDPSHALRSLSISSSSPSATTSSSARDRRTSYSTAATSEVYSDLSEWTEGAVGSDDDEDGDAVGMRGRMMAASAPVMQLGLFVPGAGGRKRSLTDALQLDGEDERVRVAMELASWINEKPSPFETDSPCSTPLPRPFPLFQPYANSTAGAVDPTSGRAVLDARGLPQRTGTPTTPAKRSYGFIPGPALPTPTPEPPETGTDGTTPDATDATDATERS